MNDADIELAVRSCVFSAVGTAGQRCTTTRRLFIQEDIHDKFIEKLIKAYKQIRIGDPLESNIDLHIIYDRNDIITFSSFSGSFPYQCDEFRFFYRFNTLWSITLTKRSDALQRCN